MPTPDNGTLADVLASSVMQLEDVTKQIYESDATVNDLNALSAYMFAVAQHGYSIAAIAEREITRAPEEHPVRTPKFGGDVQVAVSHARALFDAIGTFATTARDGSAPWNARR